MNSVNLIGRLTADPVKRSTLGGSEVCTTRIAVERVGDGSDFVNVTAFGKLAVSSASYLAKGRRVAVQGRLAHSRWQTESGQRRERHEVVANSVEFLDRGTPLRQAHLRGRPLRHHDW